MSADTSRPQVLAAARRACADGQAPTMEQFAATADVAVSTLYRLFGSRQALLHEAGCAPQPTARQRVLDAALDQVGRAGLAALSMDDLAATAGVSRATLYRLFPGKSALFGELIRAFSPWEPVADVIDAMSDGPPEEVMPAVARAIANAMHGRVGLLLRMVSELIQGDPDTAEGMRRSMARGLRELIDYLNDQMHAGRLRQMHPITAIQLLAGPIVVHLFTRPLAEPLIGFDQSQSELLDETVQAWLRAMAPENDTGAAPD
ncbi:MAG TPA: TetR family transcriptional regulator [Mycobacterium sp.]|nr:TetR family transcriptional regulator [Mycobacterium sp.]